MEESPLGITDSGESSQPPQQSSGPKRNKISRACDECRKRKVRCDGAQPCLRCQKSRTECVFVKVTPKRGPPKQYVETLEPRLRNLEQTIRTLLLETPAHDRSLSEKSIAHKSSGEFMSTDPTPSASSSSSYLTSGSVPTPTSLTPQMETVSVGSTGQAYYVNDCITRMDRIPNIYNDDLILTMGGAINNNNKPLPPLPQSPMTSLSSFTGDNNTIQDPAQPKLHPQTLANTNIQNELIHLYFTHVHPYLPILHKATFYKQLQTSPCVLLLNAIYAVAARWDQPTRESSNDGHPIGWRYYQAAFSLIDIYTDTPRLSTIQALLLLVKYQEHVRRSGFFWRTRQYFQIIVRMARDLGISRTVPSNFYVDPIMAEQRKRTFWAVYAYDVLMSTELGTEPHFKDSECTTDFPTILGDEAQTEEREVLLHFHWMAKLVHLHGGILYFARQRYMGNSSNNQSIRSSSGSSGSCRSMTKKAHDDFTASTTPYTFRSLQQKVDEMSTSLTGVLKSSTAHQSIGSYTSSFQYMLLHLSTILLHRPYALDHESSVSAERCTDSASTITHLAETLLNTGGVEILYYPIRGIQHTIHCLSAAITVHKCLAGIQGHQEACKKSLTVMNKLLESTPAAEVDLNWTPEPLIGSNNYNQQSQHHQHPHHHHNQYQYQQQQPQQPHQNQQQQQWSSAASVSSLGSLTSLNPSASRSSPILVGSAKSENMIRSKSRRTSLQSLQTMGGGSTGSVGGSSVGSGSKRRSRAGSHLVTNGGNASSVSGHSSVSTRNSDRMLRSMVSQHRLSMPIIGYVSPGMQQPTQSQPPPLQQGHPHHQLLPQQPQQPPPQQLPISPVSYSQPPSPTTSTGFYSSVGTDMYAMTANKPSPFYKQALQSSSVAAAAAAQQQLQFGEMPTRTTSTPYINRVPASHRRHTISGDAYQGQIGQISYPQQQQQSQYPEQHQQQQTVYIDPYQQQTPPIQPEQEMMITDGHVDNGSGFIYQQQQQQQHQIQQQSMLLNNTSFPMEPNSGMDTPTESMMQLLNQSM